MKISYTSSFEEFNLYCDELFNQYVAEKNLQGQNLLRTKIRYKEEKVELQKQVKQYGDELLKGLCMATYIGMIAHINKHRISILPMQCPFIMYLLHLSLCNVLEEGGLYENYMYSKSKMNVFNYSIDFRLYENIDAYLKLFFQSTGYTYMFVGEESRYQKDARKPKGIFVFKEDTNLINYVEYLGRLTDGTICILEECIPEVSREGIWYCWEKNEFWERRDEINIKFALSRNQERTLWKDLVSTRMLTIEEELLLKRLKPMDDENVVKVLAAGQTMCPWDSYNNYYEIMSESGLDIYSREDLLECLLKNGISEERAYYWAEIIRNGKFGDITEIREECIEMEIELKGILDENVIELFKKTRYLPCKWAVLEQYKRWEVLEKIL